ncbi:MAG: AsmA family protein [Pseudomonadota bacterium]
MRAILKLMLVAAGLLATILLLAIGAVYFFFDPNEFRDELALELSEATGRDVRFEGDLSLSVFPRLAISTEDVSVGNAPAFGPEPMLRFDRVSAGVDLMPLFRNEVNIQTIEVIGLTVNLAVRGDGLNNWSDIVDAMADDESIDVEDLGVDEIEREIDRAIESGADAENANVEIDTDSDVKVNFGGVVIRDAAVTYEDGSSETIYRLEDLDLTLRGDDLSEPLDLSMAFVASADPGAMRLNMELETTVQNGEDVLRITDMVVEGALASADLPEPAEFSMDAPAMTLDFANNTLLLETTNFTVADVKGALTVSGSGPAAPLDVSGNLSVDSFSPREVLPKLGIEAPVTADADALRAVSFDAAFTTTFEMAVLRELQLKIDDTTLNGEIAVQNFASMALRFDLAGDRMVLDRYLPPADESEVSESNDVTTADAALPVDMIQGLDAGGSFRFGRLELGGLPFEDLDLQLQVKDSRARLSPMRARVLEGTYEGDVRIDASGDVPRLSLNERVENLNLGTLASLLFERDNVEGRLDGKFELAGRGVMLSELRSSLDGNVAMTLSDGALVGTDLWYEIRRARATFERETPPPAPADPRTEFSTLRGTAVVSDGVAKNDDFFAEIPFLQMNGAGTVNLAEGTVDYDLDARVLERPEFLSGATPEELDAYTEAVIPLEITGELADPAIRPDIERLARNAVKEKVDEEVDRLKDRLLDRLRRN